MFSLTVEVAQLINISGPPAGANHHFAPNVMEGGAIAKKAST